VKSVFYDIDCLFSFLKVDKVDLLEETFSKIIISTNIYESFNNPSFSHVFKEKIDTLISKGFVKIEDISLNTDVFNHYYSLINEYNGKAIGKGEASIIALACKNNGTILCNNYENISFHIDKYNLKYITTGEIILQLYNNKTIKFDEAFTIWKQMIDKGINLPSRSFSLYIKDKE